MWGTRQVLVIKLWIPLGKVAPLILEAKKPFGGLHEPRVKWNLDSSPALKTIDQIYEIIDSSYSH